MIVEAQSIAFACAINLAVNTIACAFQWWRTRDAVLRDWTAGCAVGAVGSALSAQQGLIPDLFAVAAANTLVLLYFLCAHSGMRRLLRRPLPRVIWIVPLIAAVVETYAVRHHWQPGAWQIISGYARLALCLAVIVKLVQGRGVMPAQGCVMLFATLVLGALVLMRAPIDPGTQAALLDHAVAVNVLTTALALPMMLGLQALYVGKMKRALADIANTDVLTGLRNRRRFDEMAGSAMQRSSGRQQSLWLLMIDIDHFKRINDLFGHQEGDHALRLVSRVLREAVRSTDILARYGGEEFCILLPDADRNTAQATALRLRRLVSELRVGPQMTHMVTVSIGATEMDTGDCCIEDLLGRADRALYLAKSEGRNRVVGFDASRVAA